MIALTPTSDRPILLELCSWNLGKQNYFGNIFWSICDNSKTSYNYKFHNGTIFRHIRSKHQIEDGSEVTPNLDFLLNLMTLARVEEIGFTKYDKKLCIIEDDDWYNANYINFMSNALNEYDVVGLDQTIYYHIPTKRYRIIQHTNRSSLNSTAFKANLIPLFIEAIKLALKNKNIHVDIYFWHLVNQNKIQYKLYENKNLVVGLKGLPGKIGLGSGHRLKEVMSRSYKYDNDLAYLTSIMDCDITKYLRFIN